MALAGPGRAPKTYDLKNVEWHVTVHPDSGTIDGDVINSIHLLKSEDSVDFDCGPLTIGSVTVNGEAATMSLVGETLTVQLPDKGAKSDYKVEIKYSGKPTAGVYFVPAKTGYPAHTPVVYTQGEAEDNRYWLPTYDYPDNKATSEGFITVPTGWKALSNGKLLDQKVDGDMTTIHWKMDKPHSTYLISFVAGPYDIGHEKWGNMPVEYWVPEGLLDWGKAAFGGTGKIIDVYSKLTGFKYPYVKFAQSAVPDFMFGGMENITCVTQTISALFPSSVASTNDSTGLVAHELAHQWFGDTVTCEDWSHAWLNEGFATFMPPFYTRATKGEEAFQRERSSIFQQAVPFGNPLPIVWTGYKIPMENFFENLIYPGGATRMYMLMDKLGEKTFWKGIHDYLETYKYQPVTTEKFFASMSKTSGQDLTTFMKEWFYTAGIPHIEAKADGNSLVFTQSKPYFDIDPTAWIWNGKDWVKKPLHFTSTIGEVRVDVGADLAKAPVQIDPEGHYLIVAKTPQVTITPEQRVAIFEKLPAFAKTRYLRTLRQLPQPLLLSLIAEPKNKFYLGSLMTFLDKTNKDLLLKYATSTDAQLRNGAVSVLGNLYATDMPDDVKAVIQKIADSDPNDEIKIEAYLTLVRGTTDTSIVEKAWKTDSFGERYRVWALQWWMQHDKAAAKTHALEALDTPLAEPVQLMAIGILGQLKDAPGETVAYDHLITVLKGTSYAERIRALNALVSYGNKDALTAIEPLRHESLFFTKQAAEGAYNALKNAKAGAGSEE